MFITFSGEFAALTYLRDIYLLSVAPPLVKTVSPLCRMCEQCVCTALTADWPVPGSVCNQSDSAVDGTIKATE